MSIRSKLETDRATRVPFGKTSDIAATDVERAILAVQANLEADIADLAAHLADTVDAHDASAISYAGGVGLSATNVEAAIDELATEKLNIADLLTAILAIDGSGSGIDADLLDGQSAAFYATAQSVTDHLNDASDAHDASAISFSATGNIAATDVQAAIDELDAEKQPLDAGLTAIAALSTTSYGRGLLTLANATALAGEVDSFFLTPAEGNAAYQPLDELLTEIAALSTDPNADSGLFFDDSAGSVQFWTPTGALSFSGTNLQVATATDSNVGVVEGATDAEVRAATADKFMDAALLESASAGVALSDAATVAVDWDSGINFTLTVTANRVIGNPTNGQPGTWRTILVQGNDATDRTLTFDTNYEGELPTLTDVDNGRWYLLMIYCVSSSHFVVSAKRANG